ncbi:hypothetical protein GCM10027262_45180 [Nocardia tengchongensis]
MPTALHLSNTERGRLNPAPASGGVQLELESNSLNLADLSQPETHVIYSASRKKILGGFQWFSRARFSWAD